MMPRFIRRYRQDKIQVPFGPDESSLADCVHVLGQVTHNPA